MNESEFIIVGTYHHGKDIFGQDVTYGPNGETYHHGEDIFGNSVTYGPHGETYHHGEDIFGNSVTYGPDRSYAASSSFSPTLPSAPSDSVFDDIQKYLDAPSFSGKVYTSKASEPLSVLTSGVFWLFIVCSVALSIPLLILLLSCASTSSFFPQALADFVAFINDGFLQVIASTIAPYCLYVAVIASVIICFYAAIIDAKCKRLHEDGNHESERKAHVVSNNVLMGKIADLIIYAILFTRVGEAVGYPLSSLSFNGISAVPVSYIAAMFLLVYGLFRYEDVLLIVVDVFSILLLVPFLIGGASGFSIPDPVPLYMMLVALVVPIFYELYTLRDYFAAVRENNKTARSQRK